jgi:hypothetical protein
VVHGTVRGLFQLIGALALILLVALPAFVWRLSEGPLSLAFLTPYVEEALTAPDGAWRVKLEDTVLGLSGGERLLAIRAVNVRVLGSDGGEILTVPEVSISLSARTLLHGVVGLKSVQVKGLRVRVSRGKDGRFDLGFVTPEGEQAASGMALADRLLAELLDAPDPTRPLGALQRVEVKDADLTLIDQQIGATWHAPSADLEFHRDPKGIAGGGSALVELEGGSAGFDLSGRYNRDARTIESTAGFVDLTPAQISRFIPQLGPLAAVDLPMGGTISATLSLERGIEDIGFDFSGGAGFLRLPAPIATDYPVTSMSMRGNLENGLTRLVLRDFQADLGGPKASATMTMENLGPAPTVEAQASVKNLPTETMQRFWPAGAAASGRDWVVANLSGGGATQASISVGFKPDAKGELTLDHLSGGGEIDGVTVNYLDPMTKVRGAGGRIIFDPRFVKLEIDRGRVNDLRVTKGVLVFGGFDLPDQDALIDLQIEGPLADAIKLLDEKPLEYGRLMGLDPARTSGHSSTRLKFTFPLMKSLKYSQIKIEASSHLKDLVVPGALFGLDVQDGVADLKVDNKGMDLAGKIVLAGMPADLEWRENFSGQPFKSRYHLKGRVDEKGRTLLGLDSPPFVQPYLAGAGEADVVVTLQPGGKGEALVSADLTKSAIELPQLAWRKEPGVKAQSDAQILFGPKGVSAVPRFSAASDGLQVNGQVSFTQEGGAFKRAEFQRFRMGRTDVDGVLSLGEGGRLQLDVKGASLDLNPVLNADTPDDEPPGPPMAVNLALKRIWTNEKGGLDEVKGALTRLDGLWRSVAIEAVAGGKPVRIAVRSEGKERKLDVTSPDAGALLRGLDIIDNVSGGKLVLEGRFDDAKPGHPVVGMARTDDYRVVRAPILTRILTVAALTGIVDILRGEGMSFARLEAPFIYSKGRLYLSDAQTSGAALGITAKGLIDTRHEIFNIEGTLVPAYAVNSLLGNIPLIGNIFTGGEKGGGIFAFNYSVQGKADDPSVTVNPLSALTPGFLRRLFDVFDTPPPTGPETAAPAPSKPAPEAQAQPKSGTKKP